MPLELTRLAFYKPIEPARILVKVADTRLHVVLICPVNFFAGKISSFTITFVVDE
jgi:hypothetical protein